jgi:hypothetical protein
MKLSNLAFSFLCVISTILLGACFGPEPSLSSAPKESAVPDDLVQKAIGSLSERGGLIFTLCNPGYDECKDFTATCVEDVALDKADAANGIEAIACFELEFLRRQGQGEWQIMNEPFVYAKRNGEWQKEYAGYYVMRCSCVK